MCKWVRIKFHVKFVLIAKVLQKFRGTFSIQPVHVAIVVEYRCAAVAAAGCCPIP